MNERKWMNETPVTEEHSEKHGVSIWWQKNDMGGGIVFMSSVATKQSDGAILYEHEDGPRIDVCEDYLQACRLVDGFVKWDGCSHLTFGDERGYLHVCEGYSFRQLTYVLRRVAELAIEHGDLDFCAEMSVALEVEDVKG